MHHEDPYQIVQIVTEIKIIYLLILATNKNN